MNSTEQKIRVTCFDSKCFEGFAVYVHKRSDTGEPFYYGCGGKYRPTTMCGRPKTHRDIALAHGVTVVILSIHESQIDALDEETRLIKQAISNGEHIINIVNDYKNHCAQIAQLGGVASVEKFKNNREWHNKNWSRKVSNEQILEIRNKFRMKNKRESNATALGKEYGVCRTTILRIAKMERWKGVQ